MKETFYFQHDYNARNDPKLQDVLIEYGVAGIGIFWCIIEQLYEQEGRLPLKTCKSIAFALHVECKIVESIVNDFDLFENDGKYFWSNSANDRLERREELSNKRKRAAAKRWKSDEVMQVQCKQDASAMQNHAKERRGKERKYIYTSSKEEDKKEKTLTTKNPENEDEKEKKGCAQKKEKETRAQFVKPTTEDVQAYISEKGYSLDADQFVDHYEANGWLVGKSKMKDWKAAVRNWERRRVEFRGARVNTRVDDNIDINKKCGGR